MPVKKDSQEARIANFFTYYSDLRLTPPEVKNAVGFNCPLTSVRRALTQLTSKGVLRKTNETAEGLFGTTNHKWGLATR